MSRAQYGGDPYRGYVDQMVIDHMNQRRLEERLKSRPHWKTQRRQSKRPQSKTRSPRSQSRSLSSRSASHAKTASTTRGKPAQRVTQAAPAIPTGSLSLSQDMFSSFGDTDARGYVLEVTLTPQGQSGGVVKQRLQLNSKQGNRTGILAKVPAGRYVLTARSIPADGLAHPALIGTECGSPTDPKGGNFAASLPVTMEAMKGQWGNVEVRCSQSIWFRP